MTAGEAGDAAIVAGAAGEEATISRAGAGVLTGVVVTEGGGAETVVAGQAAAVEKAERALRLANEKLDKATADVRRADEAQAETRRGARQANHDSLGMAWPLTKRCEPPKAVKNDRHRPPRHHKVNVEKVCSVGMQTIAHIPAPHVQHPAAQNAHPT